MNWDNLVSTNGGPTNREIVETARHFTSLYAKPPSPMTFVMNPANREAFDDITKYISQPTFECKVFMEDGLPIRKITKRWHPPADSRFCGYGPEDEAWMRPLGLGHVEEVDDGPMIFALDMSKLWADMTKPFPMTGLFGATP